MKKIYNYKNINKEIISKLKPSFTKNGKQYENHIGIPKKGGVSIGNLRNKLKGKTHLVSTPARKPLANIKKCSYFYKFIQNKNDKNYWRTFEFENNAFELIEEERLFNTYFRVNMEFQDLNAIRFVFLRACIVVRNKRRNTFLSLYKYGYYGEKILLLKTSNGLCGYLSNKKPTEDARGSGAKYMREFLEETKITHIDLIFKYWPGNFFYTITSNLNLRGLKRILCHLVINKRRSHGEKKGRKTRRI